MYNFLWNQIYFSYDNLGRCKIEIRYKLIGNLWVIKWYHAYVLTTDIDGSRKFYRGGPEADSYDLSGHLSGGSVESGQSASSNSGSMGSNSESSNSNSTSSESESESSQGSNSGSDSSNSNSGSNSSNGSGSSESSNSNSSASHPGAVRSPGYRGSISTKNGEYVCNTPDWETIEPPTQILLSDNRPCFCHDKALEKATAAIANKRIPYHPLSTNSNATAHQIVFDAGIVKIRPVPPKGIWPPGHDVQL